jgi:arylsulfatase
MHESRVVVIQHETQTRGATAWLGNQLFLFVPAQVIVKQFMQTMVEFPPRQKAASFTVGDVMEKLGQNSAQMARSAGAGT